MKILAEMMFGREDDPVAQLGATSLKNGQLDIEVHMDNGRAYHYPLPIQQVIQLRDFLNRHIDTFALQALGADPGRASDDPGQLPAVAEIPASQILQHPV